MSGFSPDFGAWQSFTPTLTSSAGSITSTNTLSGRYKQIGKLVFFQLTGAIGTNGTGSGFIKFSLPVPAAGANYPCACGNTVTGGAFTAAVNGTTQSLNVFSTTGAYPGADSTGFVAAGCYEAA